MILFCVSYKPAVRHMGTPGGFNWMFDFPNISFPILKVSVSEFFRDSRGNLRA